MTSACANLKDGLALASTKGAVTRGVGTKDAFGWKVASQSGGRAYHVHLYRSSQQLERCDPPQVSDQIECTCPGYGFLKKQGRGKICKHCAAILASCLKEHGLASPQAVTRGDSALRSHGVKSSSGGRAKTRLALEDTREVRIPSKTVSILKGNRATDSQPREPSLVPAAGAVRPDQDATSEWTSLALTRKEAMAIVEFFRGYDEQAEDAAHLIMNKTAQSSRVPSYGGVLISLMSGKQTQKMVVYVIKKATYRVFMTGFTFDLLMIAEALIEAAQR